MKTLKSFLLASIFCFSIGRASSQHLDVQFGGGTGESYIIEQKDASDINFTGAVTMFGALKFTPDSSYFSVKLLFQYLNTKVNGYDWEADFYVSFPLNSGVLDGQVSTLTSFLLLEHITNNKRFNFGYDFGIGLTEERFIRNKNDNNYEEVSKFMSVRVAGIMALKLGKRSQLSLEPVLFWTDPVNSFRSENYQIAGEGLSFLINIGYAYRLF